MLFRLKRFISERYLPAAIQKISKDYIRRCYAKSETIHYLEQFKILLREIGQAISGIHDLNRAEGRRIAREIRRRIAAAEMANEVVFEDEDKRSPSGREILLYWSRHPPWPNFIPGGIKEGIGKEVRNQSQRQVQEKEQIEQDRHSELRTSFCVEILPGTFQELPGESIIEEAPTSQITTFGDFFNMSVARLSSLLRLTGQTGTPSRPASPSLTAPCREAPSRPLTSGMTRAGAAPAAVEDILGAIP
jgi:hypothetical protein